LWHGKLLIASAHFWKVPYEQDHQRSDNSENGHFYPDWNGHGIAPSKIVQTLYIGLLELCRISA
jgi:hypothetical protein